MSEGSEFRAGSTWFRMFEDPLPEGLGAVDGGRTPRPGRSGSALHPDAKESVSRDGIFGTLIEGVEDHPDRPGKTIITITEKSTGKVPPYMQLPMALTSDRPIPTASIEAALAELARIVGSTLPGLPKHAALDVLRRMPPRLTSGSSLPAVSHDESGAADYISAITAAVEDLDRSYVAVQGPPGTGKTYVGSHVIARLVRRGWKVGVVAQSHSVVENILCTAIETAGVDPAVVAKDVKAPRTGAHVPWELTTDQDVARILTGAGGCLVGGTAWTMTGRGVPPGSLDLLVIDEAGQYSLANTLAVAQAAKRMLLLGDPQQLPQVTQGSHPEPVDESALGWLSDGQPTMPAELGYFLADSWRMHPALCQAVSVLSYDGRLQWRAVIVRSPELTNYMPHKPSALEELGAFIGLGPRPFSGMATQAGMTTAEAPGPSHHHVEATEPALGG